MEMRGSVTDRPWGVTLGAIALRRHTGQLTIESDGKRFDIAFEDGAIVAASSPLAADAIARIALTNHFITSTQVADITRRLALSPDRDEVEVLARTARCSPEQILKLRHRLVAQRAARTFSLERGDFVLEDHITLPVFAGVAVDHRHVIYLGVRTNLSEQRLLDDLRQLGSHFVLRPEAIDELPRFGFEPGTHPVIEALEMGTSLPALEASHREIDPRSARAIIYALVSCNACAISSTPRPRTTTPATDIARAATLPFPRDGATVPHDAPFAVGTVSSPPPALSPLEPAPHVAPGKPPHTGGRVMSSPYALHTRPPSPTAYSGVTVEDPGTNTPAAMRTAGAAPDVAPPRAPVAHPAARPSSPSPRRTPPRGIPTQRPATASDATPPDDPRPAESRTTTSDAEVIRGFTDQRTPNSFGDQRTPNSFGDQHTPADQRTPPPSPVSTDTTAAAAAAFKRGELAMKRDQPAEAILAYKTACELDPNEIDYAGMLAWAKFCAASDKAAVGGETRKILERTAHRSHRPERARFYLGRVERMLGRDKEALRHFQEVLALDPNHAEAASEVRAIEARLQATGKPGTSLFGRKR